MAALQLPVAVVSPQLIASCPMDLKINRTSRTKGTYIVTDVNGAVIFQIEGSSFSLHDRRVLTNCAGHPIITFQDKVCSLHRRWFAYRGNSRDPEDLLFTVQAPALFQSSFDLDVILSSNTVKGAYDFKIKESSTESFNYTVFLHDGTTAVALLTEMKPHIITRKDTFRVTVHPSVDYAFMVALGVIVYEILRGEKKSEMYQALLPISGVISS